jgi:hypothetical protein
MMLQFEVPPGIKAGLYVMLLLKWKPQHKLPKSHRRAETAASDQTTPKKSRGGGCRSATWCFGMEIYVRRDGSEDRRLARRLRLSRWAG